MLIVVPLCLALSSCSKSPGEACDELGKSLGEAAAKASGRVVKSAQEAKKKAGIPSSESDWDPETQPLPPGMKAVHQK